MKKALFVSVLMLGFANFDVNAANYYIGNIEIEGLKRVEEETVLAYLGVNKGDNVSQTQLDGALKNLYATGLFSDIQMENKSGGILFVKLEENPIIGQRAFDGNEKLEDKILES